MEILKSLNPVGVTGTCPLKLYTDQGGIFNSLSGGAELVSLSNPVRYVSYNGVTWI